MINKALKLIRQYHNKTLTEAAAELGVSKSYLSEVERGKKTPSLEVLESYASVFKMPLSSIMFFAEQQGESTKDGKLRRSIAQKTIKMLDWVQTVT